MSAFRSKLTYRIFTLTRFGAETSYALMSAIGTQPIVGKEWFNLQYKAVIYITNVVN